MDFVDEHDMTWNWRLVANGHILSLSQKPSLQIREMSR